MELIWFRLCRAVRIVPCSVQVTLKCLSDNRRLQDIKINKNNQKLFDIFFKKGGQSKDTHLAVCVGPEMSWRPVRGRTPPLAPRLQPPRHPIRETQSEMDGRVCSSTMEGMHSSHKHPLHIAPAHSRPCQRHFATCPERWCERANLRQQTGHEKGFSPV